MKRLTSTLASVPWFVLFVLLLLFALVYDIARACYMSERTYQVIALRVQIARNT